MSYIVDINWDEEAAVWYAVCDEIPLAIESGSLDALVKRTNIVAREILEINNETCLNTSACSSAG